MDQDFFLMPMSQLQKISANDIELYRQVCIDTFIEAYQDQNSAEDIHSYVNTYFTFKMMQDEFEDPTRSIYVVKDEHEISGYVKLALKPIPEEVPLKNPLEISRIYIRKKHYGTGLGQTLMRKAEDHCIENGNDGIFLGVWQENKRAIAFYQKCGFKICGETTFDWGTGKIDHDWWMVKSL